MKSQEQTRAVLTSKLLPKKEWFSSRSEWYDEACEARLKAHSAVAMAAELEVELGDVVMPSALVTALREISCAPAVHWVLDLVDRGVSVGQAVAITEALDHLQMEDDEAAGRRPWGWAEWETVGGDLIWATGSGRTTFIFSAAGASLTRFAGGGSEVTGEWVFGPSGLLEGWVSNKDDRSCQLSHLLGGLGESPSESEQADQLELEAVTAERAAANKARKGKARRKARGARREARGTWDRPVA